MDFWTEVYRTSSELALWWAERWMELPSTFAAFVPAVPAAETREVMAEAAEAAAATLAAPVLEALTVVPETPAPAPRARPTS